MSNVVAIFLFILLFVYFPFSIGNVIVLLVGKEWSGVSNVTLMMMWFFFNGQAYHLRVSSTVSFTIKGTIRKEFFFFGRLILLRSLLFFVGWHNYLINILKSIMVSLASVCYMYVSWRGNGRSVCSLLWDVTNVIAIFFFSF